MLTGGDLGASCARSAPRAATSAETCSHMAPSPASAGGRDAERWEFEGRSGQEQRTRQAARQCRRGQDDGGRCGDGELRCVVVFCWRAVGRMRVWRVFVEVLFARGAAQPGGFSLLCSGTWIWARRTRDYNMCVSHARRRLRSEAGTAGASSRVDSSRLRLHCMARAGARRLGQQAGAVKVRGQQASRPCAIEFCMGGGFRIAGQLPVCSLLPATDQEPRRAPAIRTKQRQRERPDDAKREDDRELPSTLARLPPGLSAVTDGDCACTSPQSAGRLVRSPGCPITALPTRVLL